MRKLKLASVFVLLTLLLSAGSGVTMAQEPPIVDSVPTPTPAPSPNAPSNDIKEFCYPSSWKECTPWYYDSCCQMEWCVCCVLWWCDPYLRCTCNTEYRNCRDCTRNPDCSESCGSWYSEWRDDYVGCSGIGCQ